MAKRKGQELSTLLLRGRGSGSSVVGRHADAAAAAGCRCILAAAAVAATITTAAPSARKCQQPASIGAWSALQQAVDVLQVLRVSHIGLAAAAYPKAMHWVAHSCDRSNVQPDDAA